MTEIIEQPTAEEIARSYNAAMDSVTLLAAGKPEDIEETEWEDCKQRNIDHLKIQLAKPEFYEGYDLTPFENAVK